MGKVTRISFLMVVDGEHVRVDFLRSVKIEELLSAKDSIGSFLRSIVASVERGDTPDVIRANEEFDS